MSFRLLFVIPHYHKPKEGAIYGSMCESSAARAEALSHCILSLHGLYGNMQEYASLYSSATRPANDMARGHVDIIVCTTETDHVLSELQIPAELYSRRNFSGNPMQLGFECHSILREHHGE